MDSQDGFQDMSQPPTPSAFQHIPGLHHPVAPASQATNSHSYSQNTQQPPLPPGEKIEASEIQWASTNYYIANWPSDPNAFFALMQMQNPFPNAQAPPPSFPGFSFPPPPPSFPHTPQLPATPIAFAPQPIQPLATASGRLQEMMESDAEEGEVSDGEYVPPPPDVSYVPPVTQLPRSVPQESRPAPPQEAYNPDQPAAGQTVTKASTQKASQQQPPPTSMANLQQQRDQAKQFIKLLHSNNMGYRTLANESLDLDLLRDLYSSLNLPSEPAPIAPPKAKQIVSETIPTSQPAQHKAMSLTKTSANVAAPAKSAPSPVDRKEYIARLQAAKLAAKQPNALKADPPQRTPPVSAAPTVQPIKTPQAATTPSTKPPVTDEQRARTTELIKQRLEALKAKGQPTSVSNAANTAASAQNETTGPPTASGVNTPNSHTPSFPGIPGLFMVNPPHSANNASTVVPTSTLPQKRPAQSDSTGTSTPQGSITPYTRPLGESPHAYQEEPMIIEVSDDESNGSEMDIDDDQAQDGAMITTPSADQQRSKYPGKIPDFPSQPGSAFPGSSAASTPGPQTPATQAREDELKRKEDQLAAMKAKLRQKIADRIAKEKADKAAAVTLQNSAAVPAQPKTLTPAAPVEIPTSASQGVNELIRDVKRRRRAEIQTELPTIDAELASNKEKMAKLAKELETLKALNGKIAADRQRLTNELESLGIDTDGMSHAEMRAKRDEIVENGILDPSTILASEQPELSSSEVPSLHAPGAAEEHQNAEPGGGVRSQEVHSLPVSASISPSGLLPGFSQYDQSMDDSSTRPSQISAVDEPLLADSAIPNKSAQVEDRAESRQSSNIDTAPVTVQTLSNTVLAPVETPISIPEDDDDFYSPPPPESSVGETCLVEAGTGGDAQPEAEPQLHAIDVLSEEGEVEMSESSDGIEQKYEPQETASSVQILPQEAQGPEVGLPLSDATSDVSTEDEEAYEPPDVDIDMSDDQATGAEDDLSLDQSHIDVEDGAMDIASSSEDSSSESDSEESNIDAGHANSISICHDGQPDTDTADDLAPDLQPEINSAAVSISPLS